MANRDFGDASVPLPVLRPPTPNGLPDFSAYGAETDQTIRVPRPDLGEAQSFSEDSGMLGAGRLTPSPELKPVGKPIDLSGFGSEAKEVDDSFGRYVIESGKAIARGTLDMAALGTVAAGIMDPSEGYRRDIDKYRDVLMKVPGMSDEEYSDFLDRVERNESIPTITKSILRVNARDLRDGTITPDAIAKTPKPTPIRDRPLVKKGQELSEKVQEKLGAAPGWENSITVALSEGLGSFLAGGVVSLVSPAGAGALFTAAGVGESAQRALDYDEAERAAGRPGLTEDQMLTASLYGVAPGATDMLPLEFLLAGFRVPAPLRRPLARAILRIGGQTFIEGVQEGGQEYIQNLIAQEVYDPDQDLWEGVAPSAAVGGGVGFIVSLLAEVAKSAAPGRRRGGPGAPPPGPAARPQEGYTPAPQAPLKPTEVTGLPPPTPPPAGPVLGEGILNPTEVTGGPQLPPSVGFTAGVAQPQEGYVPAPETPLRPTEPAPEPPLARPQEGYTPRPEQPLKPTSVEGTREKPIDIKTGADIRAAEEQIEEPTEEQAEAGNYKKAHVKWQGIDITVENAKGSIRSGKDADGEEWQVEMPAAYGYAKRTTGAEGDDQIDFYIGDSPDSRRAFIVNQNDLASGEFDEHKVMVGFPDQETAMRAYEDAFSDGRGADRIRSIVELSVSDLKDWMANGDTSVPYGEETAVAESSEPTGPRPETGIGAEGGGLPVGGPREPIEGESRPGGGIREGGQEEGVGAGGPEGGEGGVSGPREPGVAGGEETTGLAGELIDELFAPSDESVAKVTESMKAAGGDPAAHPELVTSAAIKVDDGMSVADAIEEAALELDATDEQEIVDETVEGEVGVNPVTGEEEGEGAQTDEAEPGPTPEGETGAVPEGEGGQEPRPEGGPTTGGPKTPPRGEGGKGGKTAEELAEEIKEKQRKEKEAQEEGKPEKPKITDAGEKIGGARKDEWATTGLTEADLEGMSEEEREAFTTKENVWPRPDYAALVKDEKRDPHAVYLMKILYDRIGTKPYVSGYESENKAELYIRVLNFVREPIEAIKTVEDAKAVYDKISSTYKERFGENSSWYRLMDIVGQRRGRRTTVSFSPRITSTDVSRAMEAVKNGFPEEAAWTRFYVIRDKAGWRFELEGEKQTLAIDHITYDIRSRLNDGTLKGEKINLFRLIAKKNGQILGEFTAREEAEAAAQAAYEAHLEAGREGRERIPTRPHLDELKRTGPDYRQGRNIETAEQFIETFGFRGAEFGNWVMTNERQKIVNFAYDAFMDLARVLGVPPKAMSLNGTLAIGFGSRGRGGKNAASAHYEPLKHVINMTKIKGAGSLAHEWLHALDHYLSSLEHGDVKGGPWPSGYDKVQQYQRAKNLAPKLAAAFYDMMTTLHVRKETDEELRERLDADVKKYRSGRDGWRKYIKELDDAISGKVKDDRPQHVLARERRRAVNMMQDWESPLKRALERRKNSVEGMRGTKDTSFFEQAERLSGSGNYWKQGTELAARSFESFVFDQIIAEGNRSDYLVQGVEPTRFAEGFKGNPYPVGDERTAINEAYKRVIKNIGVAEGKLGADTRIIGLAGEIDESESVDVSTPIDLGEPEGEADIDAPLGPEAGEGDSTLHPMISVYRDFFMSPDKSFSTIVEARTLARDTGYAELSNKDIDEYVETGAVLAARRIVEESEDMDRAYWRLVDLYHRQPTLGTRTSTSVIEQAYSTPIPLGYIAQRLAGIGVDTKVFEPAAGNGALIFTAQPENVIANEINERRATALRGQGFIVETNDATVEGQGERIHDTSPADVVIANPPFGTLLDEDGKTRKFEVGNWKTTKADHAIVLNSLAAMKEDGKAVLLIGSVKEASDKEKAKDYNSQAMREFFWRLYQSYNVVDHFTVSGDLYKKQGAGWPVDVIVIDGRGKSSRPYPAVDLPVVYTGWDDLRGKLDDAGRISGEGPNVPGEEAAGGEGLAGGGRGGRGAAGTGGAVAEPAAGGSAEQPAGVRGGSPGGERSDLGEQSAAGASDAELGPGQFGDSTGSGERNSDLSIADSIIDEVFDEEPETTTRPEPTTAGEAFTRAGEEAAIGFSDALKGLDALFFDPDKLSGATPGGLPTFDPETYQKAKPFFEAAMVHFKGAARNVREAMKFLIRALREQLKWTHKQFKMMAPYLDFFIAEYRDTQEASVPVQVPYVPASKVPGLKTLVPTPFAEPLRKALADLENRRGPVDQYVMKELDYTFGELSEYFGAEQVDAIALAIDNVQKGAGFILGDQTGIGKGRVVAAALRYAHRNGLTPIFDTAKTNLYGDMIRDMRDIGFEKMLGRFPKIFVTNQGIDLPIDDEALDWYADVQMAAEIGEKRPAKSGKFLKTPSDDKRNNVFDYTNELKKVSQEGGAGVGKSYDLIFSTYDQLNPRAADTQRRRMIRDIASNAFFVLDESHNAAGTGTEDRGETPAEGAEKRSVLIRELLTKARASMFSSATYAKRANVIDLYAVTDMGKAVEQPEMLGELIGKGGVPMQQVNAAMLTEAGQYIRRERSFEDVKYELVPVDVDEGAYRQTSTTVQGISAFDIALKHSPWWDDVKAELAMEAAGAAFDPSTGDVGISSSTFSSVMHNVVSQMLLSIKIDSAADLAIDALKRGEKPVITVSNTMGAFVKDYAEEHKLNKGDPINLSFRDILRRALRRTMRITVALPSGDKIHLQVDPEPGEDQELPNGDRIIHMDLPFDLRQMYDSAAAAIDALNVENMPVSPIDWIHFRLNEAGYKVGEITGRSLLINYAGKNQGAFGVRSGREINPAGRRLAIRLFNERDGADDENHAMIMNRAGSTGLSLHASGKFKNQKQRHMIIAQAELNIDEHMQMLGRIHRTGQVVGPIFSQVYADVPAEARPTAVLAKKMASLNANTTAKRRSKFSTDDSVDFINKYGDRVVGNILEHDMDLQMQTGLMLDLDEPNFDNIASKFTGRLLLLDLEQQREVLDNIIATYNTVIEQLNEAGENDLEAKTFDLQAVTTNVEQVKPGTDDSSPFTRAVFLEELDIKTKGKALPIKEIIGRVKEFFHLETIPQDPADVLRFFQRERKVRMQDFVQRWTELHNTRLEEEIKNHPTAETKNKLRNEAGELLRRWTEVMSMVYPGRGVHLPHLDKPGITVKVERRKTTGQRGQPLALGAWTAEIAVADNTQRVIVPLSSVALNSDPAPEEGARQVQVFPGQLVVGDILSTFEAATQEGRETRYAITGNILSGYDVAGGKGLIFHFTDDQGTIRPGIYMPRSFKPKTFMEERPVVLPEARHVVEYVDRTVTGVESRDGRVTIAKTGQRWEFNVPSSRSKGFRYFGHPDVIAVVGNDGFRRQGRKMTATFYDRQQAERLTAALIKAGALFQAKKHQETAEEIVHGRRQEGGSTVLSRGPGRRSRISLQDRRNIRSEVREAIRRVAGSDVNIEFFDEISADSADETYKADMQRYAEHGEIELGGGLGRTMISEEGEAAIGIAMGMAHDPRVTAYHEAYHRVEIQLASDAEMRMLNTPFNIRKARMLAAQEMGLESRQTEKLAGYEARAIAFERYARLRDQGVSIQLSGLPRPMALFFEKIRRLMREIRRIFGSHGYNTLEDVFEAAYEGEFTGRERNLPGRLTSELSPEIGPRQTDAAEFKAWFRDSKVVDENGEPLVVYHGAKESFDTFFTKGNPKSWRHLLHGAYFTPSPTLAAIYAGKGTTMDEQIEGAQIYPVYLSLQNPKIIREKDTFWSRLRGLPPPRGRPDLSSASLSEKDVQDLRDQGYDGIINETMDEIVVFDQEQVKSAIGNRGTFDPTEVSIVLSQRSRTRHTARRNRQTFRRRVDELYDTAADKYGAWYRPLGRLAKQKKYLGLRYETLGKIARIEKIGLTMNQIFRNASETVAEEVYIYMTDRNVDPGTISDPVIREAAARAKQDLARVGQELVDRGLLSEEAYEEYKEQYLPRVYLKHLTNVPMALSGGPRPSDMGYLKHRKDIPEDVRHLILGEIYDPAFLIPKGWIIPSRDIAILDFLEEIAEDEDWVLPNQWITVNGFKATPYYFKAEASRIRQMAHDYFGDNRKANALARADQMDRAADAAIRREVEAADYKRIPDTRRYGRLRGLAVRKEIYDDIIGTSNMVASGRGIAEQIFHEGGALDKLTGFWKMNKVALNPPSQVRNFVSNGIMAHLFGGIPFARVPDTMVRTLISMKNDGRHWQVAKKYGVTKTTFASQEMAGIIREAIRVQKKTKNPLMFMWNFYMALGDNASRLYGMMEGLFKTAVIMDAMERRGMSEEDAALAAHEAIFDYSLAPSGVKMMRSRFYGVPFIMFQYKVLPRLIETAIKHPFRYLPYIALPYLLHAMLKFEYDADDEDLEKLLKALPQWMQDRGSVYILPMKDALGRWQAVDFGYFMPWGMFTEMGSKLRRGEVVEAVETVGIGGAPTLDLLTALRTGIDPFTKRPISNENDPMSYQIADRLLFVWRTVMPTWLTDIGAAGHLQRALGENPITYWGDPAPTLGQAAGRMVGANVYPIDPGLTREINIKRMERDIDDTRSRMRYRLRDQRLTTAERREIALDFEKVIREKSQRLREYVRESLVPENLQ